MASPLRIESPGALYHVISRGHERCPVVRDDEARALAPAASLGRVRCGYSATAAAERLGCRGPSGVSHTVRREAPERLRAIPATLEGNLICCLFTIQALTPLRP